MRVTPVVMLLLAAEAARAQQAIPTPESVLGFRPGDDFKLATYEESIAYFQRLDSASDYLQLLNVGKTSEGLTWYLAVISSPQNLANLEHYREAAQRLAHVQGLTDDDARKLAAETPAFVDISGGLHASEVAGAQHTIQLAHDVLARTADPAFRATLDSVVLFLWPSLNPDGQDIVVNWYRENVGGPYEGAPLHELYQKYIGHDNNRDGYMLNVQESRVVTRAWRHWEPQIIYVHHQSSPFPTRIWVPPFAEPIAPRSPALTVRELNAIGTHIAEELEANGQPGATHGGTGFDAWYPGYIDYFGVFQNIASFWTETALYRYATPYFYTLSDFPQDMRDFRAGNLYVSPWKGGWWHLRDAVNYMLTASFAVLDYATKNRAFLLYNRYQSGRDQIRRFEAEPPYAYLIPQQQRDPTAAVELLRRMAFHGIEIDQLTQDAAQEGMTYPKGTWVIPMSQAYGEVVRQLFEAQAYPDLREFPGGPPEQPYDAAGWTLPYQMDVRVVEAQAPLEASLSSAMKPVQGDPGSARDDPAAPLTSNPVAAGIAAPAGGLSGAGARVALDPAQSNSFRVINRVLAQGGAVSFQPAAGRYLVDGVPASTVERWVQELGVRAERTGAAGGVDAKTRVALYKPWRASMDEGWTRWLLDQYGFRYSSITNADFQSAALRERFDVIVLASDSPDLFLNGYTEGSVPPRYAGGLRDAGVRALDQFVRGGGTLVCLSQSSDFAIQQLHLPVKDVVRGLPRQEFFASGSILEVTTDPAHQVMSGMPERAKVFFDESPVFTTLDGFEGQALAKYAPDGSPLLSGYLLGEKHLQGYAAALDVKHGQGHVILLGFRPQWRGQPMGTFRVIFNAVLFGSGASAGAKGTPGFWSTPAAAPAPAEKRER
jgi:hypothetical protein